MSQFAEKTSVSSEKSRAEIETMLSRYGADAFGYMTDGPNACVHFRCKGRFVRFVITQPDKNEKRFIYTPHHQYRRTPEDAFKTWEQECRRLWRSLALVIKAKLECIASGIATFDTEFLPYIVLPGNKTVAEHALPMIEKAYTDGQMPKNFLGLPSPEKEEDTIEVKV